ncbi:tetratricopeptide repeat protein [Nannocystis pusilla]|uniref:tetratricopeptide repeat protein n=1 Tax=Nannocystis pusilla TaxID=889268 RepID=UPI003D66965C
MGVTATDCGRVPPRPLPASAETSRAAGTPWRPHPRPGPALTVSRRPMVAAPRGRLLFYAPLVALPRVTHGRRQRPSSKAASPISKRVGGERPANEPYERAVALLHSDPRTAVELFKAAAKLQPERPRIHVNLSWALSKLGLHAEARAAAQRAHRVRAPRVSIALRGVQVPSASGPAGFQPC